VLYGKCQLPKPIAQDKEENKTCNDHQKEKNTKAYLILETLL